MSQSQCGRTPLRPAIHRRLGGPLPHQLANGPQTHPQALQLKPLISRAAAPLTSPGITPCFHELSLSQGQIIYVLLTRSPLSARVAPRLPSDLHA